MARKDKARRAVENFVRVCLEAEGQKPTPEKIAYVADGFEETLRKVYFETPHEDEQEVELCLN